MWVVCDVCCCYHIEGGAVVDDYCDKFKDIDGDQFAVLAVRIEEEGAVF
jgi:hypothetical protein